MHASHYSKGKENDEIKDRAYFLVCFIAIHEVNTTRVTHLQSPCAVVGDKVLRHVARERVLLSKDHVDLGGRGDGKRTGNRRRYIQRDVGCIYKRGKTRETDLR